MDLPTVLPTSLINIDATPESRMAVARLVSYATLQGVRITVNDVYRLNLASKFVKLEGAFVEADIQATKTAIDLLDAVVNNL